MNVWRVLWIAWIVFVLVSFLVLEIAGYSHHGTLSEQVWQWLGLGEPLTLVYCARRVMLCFFEVWIFLHFFYQVE